MSPEALFGYPSVAHRDVFQILDAIRELPGRLCSCSDDFAWFTPSWVWIDGWSCPWTSSVTRSRDGPPR